VDVYVYCVKRKTNYIIYRSHSGMSKTGKESFKKRSGHLGKESMDIGKVDLVHAGKGAVAATCERGTPLKKL